MDATTEKAPALPLAGQIVVVTGRLARYTRAQAEEQIRRLGGTVGSSVTSRTTLLIVGEDAGSKLASAEDLGIRRISEEEFHRVVAGEPTLVCWIGKPATAKPSARRGGRVAPDRAAEREPAEWARTLERAREMLAAYLDRDGGRHVYGQRPGDTAEGRSILDSPPAFQVAVIHAAVDELKEYRSGVVSAALYGPEPSWERWWKIKELLGVLLRHKQPFMPEDVQSLVDFLAQARPWDYRVPTMEILRGLDLVVPPGQWTSTQRDVFRRLLDHIGAAYMARGDRLTASRLLRAMIGGPADETEEASDAVLPPQIESDPEALRRDATERVDAYLEEAVAVAEDGRRLPGLADLSTGLDLIDAEAPLQLAMWEVAVSRLWEAVQHGEGDRSPRHRLIKAAQRQALEQALAHLPNGNLGAIVGQVAGVIERVPEMPGFWQLIWFLRAPLTHLLARIEEDGLAKPIRPQLRQVRDHAAPYAGLPGIRDLLLQLDRLLDGSAPSPIDVVDDWGYAAQAALDAMDEPGRSAWVRLLAYARDASGTRPSTRWLREAQPLVDAIGGAAHLELTGAWLDLLAAGPVVPQVVPARTYSYTNSAILTEGNAAILRGLAWLSTLGETRRIAPQLAAAAIRCFAKVPGSGPRAIAVGNACLHALGTLDPLEGVKHLQTVRHRVTYLPALKIIDAALGNAAARSGLSKEELEDLAVPDYGLLDGRRREEIGDYAAELHVEPGGVEVRWSKAGAPLRSEPAAARRQFPEEVKALKATAEELRKQLVVQRERLERALAIGRTWTLESWRERCFDHPLLSVLARRLIWCFEGPTVRVAAWDGRQLVDVEDQPLGALAPDTRMRLWHPIGCDPSLVLAWRDWLDRRQVTQPFKQAHREVYVLTDAELRTRTYSNRFAAHILRQHQMHALAQARGWKAPLAMVYDGGWDAQLTLALPTWDLEASYFVEGVLDTNDLEAGYNDNGVCLYVSTDQVRFRRLGQAVNEPLLLAEVPALAFSEVMRDVDLFVGVASVGADPTWNDRGTTQQRAYWQHYAFGELSESAKTRRAVLERLLPRLTKLEGRWRLAERFLHVRGELRTYKIHLGSGNILMEPNDQYLCIVPDRRMVGAPTGGIFLPFEGDATLALILSKALLLAQDTKITDPSITRQIGAAR